MFPEYSILLGLDAKYRVVARDSFGLRVVAVGGFDFDNTPEAAAAFLESVR